LIRSLQPPFNKLGKRVQRQTLVIAHPSADKTDAPPRTITWGGMTYEIRPDLDWGFQLPGLGI
jgi:hypothetical protein